jgi:hypothetical protein
MEMASKNDLTQAEVEDLATQWYRLLDVHAPVDSYQPLLTDDVELQFPEGTFKSFSGFTQWYNNVIRLFFDEAHAVEEVRFVASSASPAKISVVVRWQASVWKPPAPKSERIVLDAFQTWVVRRSAQSGKAVIATYIVDRFAYAPGSAKL